MEEKYEESKELTILKRELSIYIRLTERYKIPASEREKQINLYLDDIQRELEKQKRGG